VKPPKNKKGAAFCISVVDIRDVPVQALGHVPPLVVMKFVAVVEQSIAFRAPASANVCNDCTVIPYRPISKTANSNKKNGTAMTQNSYAAVPR
jgi:hypothetical protein